MLDPASAHLRYLLLLPYAFSFAVAFSSRRAVWASSESPFFSHLSDSPSFARALYTIQSHIASVEHQVLDSLKHQHANPALQPCEYPDTWAFPAGARILLRDLNLDPDFSAACVSQVTATHKVIELYDAVVSRAVAVHAKRIDITTSAGLDWAAADVLYNFPFNRSYLQQCVVHPVSALRIGGPVEDVGSESYPWFIDNRITDHPFMQYLPRFYRRYLSEYLRATRLDTTTDMQLMTLPLNLAADEETTDTVQNTTTFTVNRPMDVTPSHVGVMTIDQNPALREALSLSDDTVERVSDALSPSSLAILFLPLLFTLVPLAALAHASSPAVIMYTLISDVLSVVPLAIKGIELVYLGQHPHTAVSVRVTSNLDGSLAPHAVAELFAARCVVEKSVRPTGVAFLSTAMACMVVGVWLEFAAIRVRNRRLKRRKMLDEMAAALTHGNVDDME